MLSACACGAWAQISPGPLSRAHNQLSGATRCTSCHKLGGQATLRCLDCHAEIRSRLVSNHGLHASFNLPTGSSNECARCHSEHNGEDFTLVKWTPIQGSFDHSKTGYALEGKHARLACDQCHNAQRVLAAERATIQKKDLGKTFLGLSPNCVTCHKDPHDGRLGDSCQQCHSESGWKDISRFDHAKTKYRLTGQHAEVACASCHTPGSDHKPRWIGLSYSGCSDCHTDPHKATFAQRCESCHSTTGWKRVSLENVNAKYDHSKTRYPLLGKHEAVECVRCHRSGDFKKPLAFQKCTDCHTPDPHGGQFRQRADGGECAACHSVQGFKPALFGVKEHASTAYPLQLKHASVRCNQCHLNRGKDTQYKIKFGLCTDCHKDEHGGQFAAAPYVNRCERCHDLKGYVPSIFTLARHKETRFRLTGGHLATPCGECHKSLATGTLKQAARFRFDDLSCTACHSDPHGGQFKERMLPGSPSGRVTVCEACHSTVSWQDLGRFDHTQTSFPLTGAHRATACIACHKTSTGRQVSSINFKAVPSRCEQCHENVHGFQFRKAGGSTPCADCHNSNQWKPSLFDHETRTSFSLGGAHQKVRCSGCHKSIQQFQGRPVLYYSPTPKRCAACHGGSIS
jgi:hypothetical protein